MNREQFMLRSTLTGLFCGIVATFMSLVYDVIFRAITTFPISGLVNVTTIIVVCTLFLLIIGGAYNLLSYLKGGKVIFIALFFLITCFSIWKIMGLNMDADPGMNSQYRYLLAGITAIMGFCSCFLLPFLFNNKWFEEYVV